MRNFAPSRLCGLRNIALASLLGAGFASQGQAAVVFEAGDAGQSQGTAQDTTLSPGLLTDIKGNLRAATDADLYRINITDAAAFSATTNNAGSKVDLDTQIFLLTLAGAPVYFNDDASGTTFLSTLPAGSSFGPLAAGSYLLGIAGAGFNPVNSNGQLLFNIDAQGYSTMDVVGAHGGLQPAALGGFADSTFDPDNFGDYDLQLTGVGVDEPVSTVPEPSTGALVLVAGALCAGVVRRKRPATAA